ncbi:MAG: DUF177 domain-containing protein [Candidatus Eisenbacteria bacterium]|nr:DUF177 domain-containing protein [Candidatus Eisenbacteria bacterium]
MNRHEGKPRKSERSGTRRIILPISQLEVGRTPLELSIDLGDLELDNWVRPLELMVMTGSVDKFGETVTIRGHGETRVNETCSRCTQTFIQPLQVDILVFCDRRGSDSVVDARQLEQEGEVVYHDGVSVDLTNPIREAIILAEPMNPVCREDCKGLCAGCGADLNTESCRCGEPEPDPRWTALGQLKSKP